MEISLEAKKAYLANAKKNIKITIGNNQIIDNSLIPSESLELIEKIMDSNVEFVGCIASKFEVQIYNTFDNIKGKNISVTISTDGTEEIPLFHGIIDSAVAQTNKRFRKITAYDQLYTKGQKDVTLWYNGLNFPVTLKEIRDSLFKYLNIEQADVELKNDSISIEKKYNPQSLLALDVIKSICQINAVFGIINRNNKFDYITLPDIFPDEGTFPSVTLFPPFYPGKMLSGEYSPDETELPYYQSVDYEDWLVNPVDKLTIRQSESDTGVIVGDGDNNYIIQGNMFTTGLDNDTLLQMANNIFPNVQKISYHPFTSSNPGMPWLECGKDAISCKVINYEKTDASGNFVYENKVFYIFNRELKGIQALTDSYYAEGEEYQSEFLTDVGVSLDAIKQEVKEEVTEEVKNYVDEKYGTGLNVQSVTVLPENPDPNVIYLIQGRVEVN